MCVFFLVGWDRQTSNYQGVNEVKTNLYLCNVPLHWFYRKAGVNIKFGDPVRKQVILFQKGTEVV